MATAPTQTKLKQYETGGFSFSDDADHENYDRRLVRDHVVRAETKQALDLIGNDHFSRNEPGIFAPLRETLLERGDHYMHLADLKSYAQAQQRVGDMYSNPGEWARSMIINIASSGPFSSDRTIAEYAADIWGAEPCPVLDRVDAAP